MIKSIVIVYYGRLPIGLPLVLEKELESMNFYNKKFRKIASIVILVLIIAMVATMIIPYLV